MSGSCPPPGAPPSWPPAPPPVPGSAAWQAMLQQRLCDAETAYHQLITGLKPMVVSYGEGDGQKSVTYTRTNIGQLAGYIAQLKRQLQIKRRRAIRVRF